MKKILVTGALGFLGRHVSTFFKKEGFETFGIGHKNIYSPEPKSFGLDHWIESDITLESLKGLTTSFDLIVHCAGSSSVGFSISNPFDDFNKTVNGTIAVLEYLRLYNPGAMLIYPSSPAVQGEHPDTPIAENFIGYPASPYGWHKKITEELCESYSNHYDLNVTIVRYFSIYGEGLSKQLIWDACRKIFSGRKDVMFFGSGQETRDFIHIADAVSLINTVFNQRKGYRVINGGTGYKYTIKEVTNLISKIAEKDVIINFDNNDHSGNPKYYWADTNKLTELGWQPSTTFEEGLKRYVLWFKANIV